MGTMKTMKAIHKVCKWKTKENERQFYHKHFENKLWEILKQRKHLPYIVQWSYYIQRALTNQKRKYKKGKKNEQVINRRAMKNCNHRKDVQPC